MSEERPETCLTCGAPVVWCACENPAGDAAYWRARAEAAEQRVAQLEVAYASELAWSQTNREMAQEWKRLRKAAQEAERRGFGLDWWRENGDRYSLLEANIMDRLARIPDRTEDNNG